MEDMRRRKNVSVNTDKPQGSEKRALTASRRGCQAGRGSGNSALSQEDAGGKVATAASAEQRRGLAGRDTSEERRHLEDLGQELVGTTCN